jgi:argininosuccinate lyase
MLHKQGIIEKENLKLILKHLEQAKQEFLKGEFKFDETLEDVHINIESYVRKHGGVKTGVLHTARSRNDQVVTDTRMVCRDEISNVIENLINVENVLIELSEKHARTIIPGYTHLQQAMPTTFGHWHLAYSEAFMRDIERLSGAYKRVNLCPLGSAAFAGTSFPIDREYTAELLGFDGLLENSLDAVASRDFIIEVISDLSIIMSNLSRLCEEVIIFTTSEFNFIELSDDYTTGSSIMPQKKNPDIAELTRGRVGRVYGNLINILTTLKGITYSYNRDLQEDKKPLWDSLDVVNSSLKVVSGMLSSMKVKNLEINPDIIATDIANLLVRKGMPFREAYNIVAEFVKNSDFETFTWHLTEFNINLTEQEITLLTPEACVEMRNSIGSSNPKEVLRVAKKMRKEIEVKTQDIEKRKNSINAARLKTGKLVSDVLNS